MQLLKSTSVKTEGIIMHGKFLHLVMVLLVASAVAVGVIVLLKHRSDGTEQSADRRAAEECIIYSTLIKTIASKSSGNLLLIEDEARLISPEYLPPDQMLDDIKSLFPETTDDTRRDFVSQNSNSSKLKFCNDLPTNCKLLDDEELSKAVHKANKYSVTESDVRHIYPDSEGVITFSKIGFNKTFDQALLKVGKASCPLPCLSMDYVLLVKDGNAWKIQRVFRELKGDELNL